MYVPISFLSFSELKKSAGGASSHCIQWPSENREELGNLRPFGSMNALIPFLVSDRLCEARRDGDGPVAVTDLQTDRQSQVDDLGWISESLTSG